MFHSMNERVVYIYIKIKIQINLNVKSVEEDFIYFNYLRQAVEVRLKCIL